MSRYDLEDSLEVDSAALRTFLYEIETGGGTDSLC